jgi:hypothetical protein
MEPVARLKACFLMDSCKVELSPLEGLSHAGATNGRALFELKMESCPDPCNDTCPDPDSISEGSLLPSTPSSCEEESSKGSEGSSFHPKAA